MNDFFAALFDPQVPFIRYALIAGIMSSIPFGLIGSFVVVKRMTYIAGALSHAALGGIGIALYLATVIKLTFISPMTGAFVFTVFSGIIIAITLINGRERPDTIIGTIWATGMSIGLLFMAITPGYTDPMSYLFGNILLISKSDLLMIGLLNLVIIILSLLFFNQFLSIAFDEEFAKIRGLNVAFYQIIIIIIISMTVLLMITIVGIVMVIALLTIPPAIAGLFAKKVKSMAVLSVILCAMFIIGGIFVSYNLKLPTGSVTVALAGIVYLFSFLFKKIIKI
ncbi:MAG: metal ABC transporter permease [Spirochaetes bacterium]|nr:metal ABC transporter permease [Spirochaetota bacterium]